MGTFAQSAPFLWEMLTDDRIYGVNATRNAALLAAPLEFIPAWESRKPRKIAELLSGKDGTPGQWKTIVPNSALAWLQTCARWLGFAFAQIVWDTTGPEWVPRLVPWDPQWVRWDTLRRCFVVQTEQGEEVLPRPDEQPYGDGRWFVYCPYGVEHGWRMGLIRTLGEKYLMRGWTARDYASFCERHGSPVVKAKVPAKATPESKSAFFNSINNLGAQGAALLPQGANGEASFDLEMLEAMSTNYQSFGEFKASLDVDIAVVVLGQNLTTEVQGGSYAAAAVQNLVRLDKAKEDADIAQALRNQVLTHYTKYNYGDADMAPMPVYKVEPSEDQAAKAAAMQTAVSAVEVAMRVPLIDERALAEELGLPTYSESEVDAMEAAAEDDVPPDGEGGPAGEGPPTDGGGPPENDESRTQMAALSSTSVVARKRSKLRWEDQLVARSTKAAKRVMEKDVESIMSDINAGNDWDDIRHRLQLRFKGSSSTRLAELLRKGSILANLYGRGSAIKDL